MAATDAQLLRDRHDVVIPGQYFDEVTGKFVVSTSAGGGGGGGGPTTIADGADAAVGSKNDAPATAPTDNASLLALTKFQAAQITSYLGAKAPGTAAASAALIGGVYNSTQPLATAGQQQAAQLDARGNLRMRMTGTQWTMTDGIAANLVVGVNGEADATGATRALGVAPIAFNGSTFDRLRGDTEGLFTSPARRTGTNRSVLVTTTAADIIPANAYSWFLANDSASDILINIGAAANATDSDTNGSFKLRPGERLSSSDIVERGAVSAVVASGTARIKARST